MAERASIRFLHRGEIVEVEDFSPTTTCSTGCASSAA